MLSGAGAHPARSMRGGIHSGLLINLLKNQLGENVSVSTDSNLDRALKTAVEKAGSSDAEAILAALQQELGVNSVRFSYAILGSSPVGSQSLDVRVEAVNNATAAANNAANSWLGVLRYLPEEGDYSVRASMVEVNGGYILAIEVTVEQTGSTSSDDDDDPAVPGPTDVGFGNDDYSVESDNGEKVFKVHTTDGLMAVIDALGGVNSASLLKANITLTSTIDLNNVSWMPIGSSSTPYTGTFDGGNNAIQNLTINQTDNIVGFFGYVGENGKVQNVKMENVTVTGGKHTSGLVGYNDNGVIANCSVSGKIEGSTISTGGVVGANNNGKLINCKSTAAVHGDANSGGVVGSNTGTVTACCATGSVTGTQDNIGGVVGYNYPGGSVKACYSTGSVSGADVVGGVVGYNNMGSIKSCYHATGNVTTTSDKTVGGVVGANATSLGGKVEFSYWESGTVSNGNKHGTEVTDWAKDTEAMNAACGGLYSDTNANTPPKLTWEN